MAKQALVFANWPDGSRTVVVIEANAEGVPDAQTLFELLDVEGDPYSPKIFFVAATKNLHLVQPKDSDEFMVCNGDGEPTRKMTRFEFPDGMELRF